MIGNQNSIIFPSIYPLSWMLQDLNYLPLFMFTNIVLESRSEENMVKFVTEVRNLKQKCQEKFKTKCYLVKNYRSTENDLKKVSHKLHVSQKQPVLDNVKLVIRLVEDQSKSLNLWEILHLVNPHPIIEYPRENLPEQEPLVENHSDILFSRGLDLCYIFEELMTNFGWKVGDTLDIENDLCDVTGKLMLQLAEQDRSNLLDCMQRAIINILAQGTKQDDDKLRSLLITKKKYNGSNLACILLEQMILDNKDNNVSWMRIVCTQFIDLVCQLIIEPDYQEDAHWTLNYFVKFDSFWPIADIYNLMKNGLLMFHCRQTIFNRYLKIIRNFAIHPSVNVCLSNHDSNKCLECLLSCRDEETWRCLDNEVYEGDKSLDQVLKELLKDEVGQDAQCSARVIIENSQTKLENYKHDHKVGIQQELELIHNSEQKDGIEVLSSCLAATSMALYTCKGFWALNTQLVSYCLLVARDKKEKGRLLEILSGEGKSCIIAMVAATYALLGRTVDIVTSSPVLSQRDAEEWRIFYKTLELDAGCNVEDKIGEDSQCYKCPIVYGTVETFARDILKTEFLLQDVRNGRNGDIVIVDEVDSMLIDHGVQCTYLSHNMASIGMSHVEPILALIWMHVSRLITIPGRGGIANHVMEPEVFFVTLSRLCSEIDPLEILRLAEEDEWSGIKKGFTNEYLCTYTGMQELLLCEVDVRDFFNFAWRHITWSRYVHFSRYEANEIADGISVVTHEGGKSSIAFADEMMKERLKNMIFDALFDVNETKINLPLYIKEYYISRLTHWINDAFVARQMKYGREYIVENNAICPVDYKSTGVIEINQKWGDGLQQFLEMKHGLPRSPLSLDTIFLSNLEFLGRYGSNILGVSDTLGNIWERKFIDDTFPVAFASIPTSKRRKLFELDGQILETKTRWQDAISNQVESVIANERATLVICEDIATAEDVHAIIARRTRYAYTKNSSGDVDYVQKMLKAGDVVITTNLGARGTDFVTDDIVNKNGGLFVLVTFIPMNNRIEKQAFGRTGRRGATGSCQILVNRETMPEWLRVCDTVDEAKQLRDSIEMHRLRKMDEVDMMRNKHELFREYCEFKKKFVTLSNCDLDDLNIQIELLDETWAKWIQENEARIQESNLGELVQDLRQVMENCSEQARRFDSDNIYHLLKFGAVLLMKGDFEGATTFYNQVILKDPAWSAFAHYNRAYCLIQLKGDDYIRHAIDDLKATFCKLETLKNKLLLSETFNVKNRDEKVWGSTVSNDETYETNTKFAAYKIMMECQLLHHMDTQISETIEQLESIDTNNKDVKTCCRDVLDLILNVDSVTETILEEYRQLGLLFSFNIKENPTFLYNTEIVSSLVMLKTFSDILLRSEFQGISLYADSQFESKDINELMCNLGKMNDDSLAWMSRCVVAAVTTGIQSIAFIRDVSPMLMLRATTRSRFATNFKASQLAQFARHQERNQLTVCATATQDMRKLIRLAGNEHMLQLKIGSSCKTILTKNTEMESRFIVNPNLNEKLHQFEQYARNPSTHASNSLLCTIQELNKLISLKVDETTFHIRHVMTSVLIKKLEETFHEKLKPGQQLHRKLCALYGRVTTESSSNLRQFVNCIQDLVRVSFNSSQLFDAVFQTADLKNIAEVDISTAINKISAFLADEINTLIQFMQGDGYFSDEGPMLEATNKVLTSVCSDIIRSVVERRIIQTFMFDSQEKAKRSYSSFGDAFSNVTKKTLYDCSRELYRRSESSKSNHSEVSEEISRRLTSHTKI